MNENQIQDIIDSELHTNTSIVKVVKLHGDASYRTYSRAYMSDGSTYILMQMPIGKASASEEITNFKGPHAELPFINVERFLREIGLNTPKIYRYSPDDRMMILEDLGDKLMASMLESEKRSDWAKLYERAVDELVRMQEATGAHRGFDCVALKRSFDPMLLNWEFDHFLEYGIEARLGVKMSSADREVFDRVTRAITDEISSLPYGFTHRDFQSRNLIMRDDKIYIIDFQDALLGPKVYDLVALIRDSYVELYDDELDDLLARYSQKTGYARDKLAHDFSLVTVQRKLKDAGRFVYIDRVKGNPNYLKFTGVTLSYVKDALQKLTEHRDLLQVLTKYVPEWKA